MRVIYGLKQNNMKNYKVDPEDEEQNLDDNVNPNPKPPPPPPPTIGG